MCIRYLPPCLEKSVMRFTSGNDAAPSPFPFRRRVSPGRCHRHSRHSHRRGGVQMRSGLIRRRSRSEAARRRFGTDHRQHQGRDGCGWDGGANNQAARHVHNALRGLPTAPFAAPDSRTPRPLLAMLTLGPNASLVACPSVERPQKEPRLGRVSAQCRRVGRAAPPRLSAHNSAMEETRTVGGASALSPRSEVRDR